MRSCDCAHHRLIIFLTRRRTTALTRGIYAFGCKRLSIGIFTSFCLLWSWYLFIFHRDVQGKMKISDESPASMLPEELASTMPPEMVMQLIQVSSAFLVTLNSYVASTREIDRRSRRLRRSRMLLLMRLMQLREDKSQRLLAAPPPVPIPLPIPRVVRPPPAGNK